MACLSLFAFLVFCLISTARSGYVGRFCGRNWDSSGMIDSETVNISSCIDHCNKYGEEHPADNVKYAGVTMQAVCACSDSYDSQEVKFCPPGDTECHKDCSKGGDINGMTCIADPSMICGGMDWWQIYDAGSSNPKTDSVSKAGAQIGRLCSSDTPCTWNCDLSDEAWLQAEGLVHGGGQYDVTSSFCLAAAHAGVYTIGTRAEVSGHRSGNQSRVELEGSWINGIQSDWFTSSEVFVFQDNSNMSSARVSVSAMSLGTTGDSVCLVDADTSVFIQLIAINGTVLNETKYDPGQPVNITFESDADQLAYCAATPVATGHRDSRTFVPVLSSYGHDAQDLVSVTSKVGKAVMITFDKNWGRIEKAGKKLLETTSPTYTIYNVSKASTGFYKSFSSVVPPADEMVSLLMSEAVTPVDDERLIGITRLIVVESDDKQACDNGGVLKGDGTCACYPPFKGEYCEDICEDTESYGNDCQWTCLGEDCKGVFVCHQDPAGCKCASGWMGKDCSDPCKDKGNFGPNCDQKDACHCKDATDVCDMRTGICASGCADGFCGKTCTKQVPSLKLSVGSSDAANNELHVQWTFPQMDMWETQHKAQIECFYECDSQCNGNEFGNFTAKPSDLKVSLKGLIPYSSCYFNCTLTAECNGIRTDGGYVPKAMQTNATAPPAMNTSNVDAYSVAEGILLTWRTPKGEQAHLKGYRVHVQEGGNASMVFAESQDVAAELTSWVYRSAELGKSYVVTIQAVTEHGASPAVEKSIKYEFSPPYTPTSTAPPVANCENSKYKTFFIVVLVLLAIILLGLMAAAAMLFVLGRKRRARTTASDRDEYNLNEARAHQQQQNYSPSARM